MINPNVPNSSNSSVVRNFVYSIIIASQLASCVNSTCDSLECERDKYFPKIEEAIKN
jgi:hypothetical protein